MTTMQEFDYIFQNFEEYEQAILDKWPIKIRIIDGKIHILSQPIDNTHIKKLNKIIWPQCFFN
tara:strand:- start:376 stop:564 length:189 start_codon:yes stop_codon:yes gene_type:complete